MTENPTKQLFTNSRAACFRACPKRHWFAYECGLRRDRDGVALRVGTGFHAGIEAVALGLDPEQAIETKGDLEPYEAALVAAMLTVHGEVYSGQELEIVATELPFELPLRNPDTRAASTTWRLAGKIDRLARLRDGRLALLDFKTTTEDITAGSDYWQRLQLDQQLPIYTLAARELGFDVQAVVYDVVRRPMHKPLLATPTDQIKYRKDGTPYAGTRLVDETPAEFAARVAEAMRTESGRYLATHEIAVLESDLEQVRAELWHQQLAIRQAQRSGRWYRNPGSCRVPFPCAFLAACANGWTPDLPVPDGFVVVDDVHPELRTPPAAVPANATVGGQPDHATAVGPTAAPASPGPAGQAEVP